MIQLNIPKSAVVRGRMEYKRDPAWLTQDVLDVSLDNGVVIDVGWYPEHDPHGSFWIRAFLEVWDNQLIDPILRKDVNDVKEVVEQLARQYSGNLISEALSSNLVIADLLV